jgi:hypothetical protein
MIVVELDAFNVRQEAWGGGAGPKVYLVLRSGPTFEQLAQYFWASAVIIE